MSQLIGFLIAVGFGFWAYNDSKRLAERGIRVGRFGPVAWGFAVALVLIIFGVLYLVQRNRAVRVGAAPSSISGNAHILNQPPMPPAPPQPGAPQPEARDARERDRFCGGCGHELPTYVSSFCPKCGRAL
jgi:hypothetical protein